MKICATTAQLPGLSVDLAMRELHAGVHEGVLGVISTDHVQICPQTAGVLTQEKVQALRDRYPNTQLRLHANARVWPKHVLWDASSFSSATKDYFACLFARQQDLGASVMSIHAGYQDQCSWKDLHQHLLDLRALAQSFGTDVCVEGLYPNAHRAQHIGTWEEYAWLLEHDMPFALDMSHLNIVAKQQGWEWALVEDLLASPLCWEIHISHNDGRKDNHRTLASLPVWWDKLSCRNPLAIVFTEGNLLRTLA